MRASLGGREMRSSQCESIADLSAWLLYGYAVPSASIRQTLPLVLTKYFLREQKTSNRGFPVLSLPVAPIPQVFGKDIASIVTYLVESPTNENGRCECFTALEHSKSRVGLYKLLGESARRSATSVFSIGVVILALVVVLIVVLATNW